jgi:hypothetical protein
MTTGTATIQLRLHELRQIFNTIDPSPFRERDLDPDCEEFIVSWARELPRDRSLRIEIHLDRERPAPQLWDEVVTAVHGHFGREAGLQDLRRHRLLREGRLALAIGLPSLVVCMAAATLMGSSPGAFGGILRESLVIAGWVLMWHPLELLLYGPWSVIRERRLFERLSTAAVELRAPAAESSTCANGSAPRAS